MFLEKMPDPRPYLVEAEIDPGVEVKDNQLSLQISGEDATGDSYGR